MRDERLEKRAREILHRMHSHQTLCIRRLFHEPKEARCAYDFFSNVKVKREALLKPHVENTLKRILSSESDYILAIQDITVLNYSKHAAKTELGRIGKVGKTDLYGLFQHSTLCVTDRNEALGLLELQHFHNDDYATEPKSDYRAIESKKTNCWLNALKVSQEKLKGSGKQLITVADREGDFFEFLHAAGQDDGRYVIRLKHDRRTGTKHQTGATISELMKQQPVLGVVETSIQDAKTRQMKSVKLNIKRLKDVVIPVPRWTNSNSTNKNYQPITLNVVMIYNEQYTWLLLTQFSVEDLAACVWCMNIYKQRWHIEDYHKVLKTGYQIDDLYLHSSRQAIENALTMASIAACRLYWLIFSSRALPNISADKLFTKSEWQCLYLYFKEPIPKKAPLLSDIITKIARLGGYKIHKTAKPPGVKSIWLGFRAFSVAAELFNNFVSIKT